MTPYTVSAEISAYLHGLADDLTDADPRHIAQVALRTARALREFAQHRVVILPAIDPARDDLGHWTNLPDDRLRNENGCDAWNLAAGLYVAADRQRFAELREYYDNNSTADDMDGGVWEQPESPS